MHRGLVDPLRIVDKPGDRLFFGRGRHQVQGGDTHQKSLRRGALGETEHLIKNVPVQRREFYARPGERSAQLLKAGVREFHLGLDAARTADAEVVGVLGDIAQQGRLPNPGFPSKHQNPGPACSSPVEQGGEPSLFLAPSQESMEGGIESEAVAVCEPGIRDITASHGASPPPAVGKRTRGVGASQYSSCCGRGYPLPADARLSPVSDP